MSRSGPEEDHFSQQKLRKMTFILVGEEGERHAFGKRPELTVGVWESVLQHRTERISELCKKWNEKCVSVEPLLDVFRT